jgi:hypothetical protein
MRVLLSMFVLLMCGIALAGGGPKAPAGRTPEAIDYTAPDRYVRIAKSEGDEAAIRRLAKRLQSPDREQTIRNVHAFVASKVPHVPSRSWDPDFRRFEQLLPGFDHNGCAEYALLFANLLRALDIPTVYVKSSRHEWIRKYVATGETADFAGHVFLEVHIHGKWRLLEDQTLQIWDEYDPVDPELPGGLLAYEKGSDAYAMVHSTRRDLFIEEAKARWTGFDVSKLRRNESPGRALLPSAYAVTLDGEWEVLSERISSGVFSFNRPYWDEKKASVRGNLLVVTSMGGRTGIPEAEAAAWLPVSLAELRADFLAGKSLVRTRRLDDGTLVVLISAPGWNELMALIWTTDLPSIAAEFEAGRPR